MNFLMCSGKVLYLHYDESARDLSIMLLVSAPKPGSHPGSNDWYHDTPMFHAYGDKAESLKEQVKVNSRISVTGHIRGIRRDMRRQENKLFREIFSPDLCVDVVEPPASRQDVNIVVLGGNVTRVYRNADPGKNFYIPTVSVPDPDMEGHDCLANFTYFDHDMKLEPHRGDFVYVIGAVRTKREDENLRKSIVLTTIVAGSGVQLVRAGS